MWASRFFWKLFLSYALLYLAATGVFVTILSGWQRRQISEQITRRLYDSAVLVRIHVLDLLAEGRSEALQARVQRMGHAVGTRVTLVAMNGQVLADSEQPSLSGVADMENHRNRVELLRASNVGFGISQRISPTFGEPMLYVAVRAVRDDSPVGLVRTALPMTAVRAQRAAIQRLVWTVAGLVSLAVVGISYFVAARVVRPVRTLTQAVEGIAAGDYEQRVYLNTHDELGQLAKSVTRMGEELREREVQLRDSSQRLATVLEGMVEGVIALDDRRRVVLANAAAGRLFDFSPGEVAGKSLLEVTRHHKLHGALSISREVAEPQHVEIELAGGQRVLGIRVTPLANDPFTSWIVVLHDVTELRRLESMRQEFAANVSHELKTPLSSIKAYAETLLGGAIHDQGNNARFVEGIAEQAERLHQLILDLLSLARIESGQQVYEIQPVDVGRVVRALLAEYVSAAGVGQVGLQIVGPSPDLQVRADEEGLRQILANLIDNGVKYTPAGGEVTIGWYSEAEHVVLEVRDTGIGIAPEDLPRVFERFFRVDKARSRELGGTGLGLSIVKHLVTAFGGSVEAHSQVGKGTTFTVRLVRI